MPDEPLFRAVRTDFPNQSGHRENRQDVGTEFGEIKVLAVRRQAPLSRKLSRRKSSDGRGFSGAAKRLVVIEYAYGAGLAGRKAI